MLLRCLKQNLWFTGGSSLLLAALCGMKWVTILREIYLLAMQAGTDGLQDGVITFDRNNNGLVVVGDNFRDMPIQKDYSIEFWMKPEYEHHGAIFSLGMSNDSRLKPTKHGVLVEVCGPESNAPGADSTENRVGSVRFLHRNPPGTIDGTSCYSDTHYTVQTWQHVVAVKEGTTMRLYINGKQIGTAEDASLPPAGLQLHVGQLYTTHPTERSFLGQLDELAVYNRALKVKEINNHFKLTRPISRTGGAK